MLNLTKLETKKVAKAVATDFNSVFNRPMTSVLNQQSLVIKVNDRNTEWTIQFLRFFEQKLDFQSSYFWKKRVPFKDGEWAWFEWIVTDLNATSKWNII